MPHKAEVLEILWCDLRCMRLCGLTSAPNQYPPIHQLRRQFDSGLHVTDWPVPPENLVQFSQMHLELFWPSASNIYFCGGDKKGGNDMEVEKKEVQTASHNRGRMQSCRAQLLVCPPLQPHSLALIPSEAERTPHLVPEQPHATRAVTVAEKYPHDRAQRHLRFVLPVSIPS